MISSSQSKLIRSLAQKKYRDLHRRFLIEGEKMVRELIISESETPFQILEVFATPDWLEKNQALLQSQNANITEAAHAEIRKVSRLVTPQAVIAIVSMPIIGFHAKALVHAPVLVFESIRDPGNLGTIIRTADWFGIRHLVCTPDSTDQFNPKVVQSTMGAFARVQVHYQELEPFMKIKEIQSKTIYGTFMDGDNIYKTNLAPDSLILFGNESHGLSGKLDPYLSHKISIPSFSPKGAGSESLNIASSVAVVCSELRRR